MPRLVVLTLPLLLCALVPAAHARGWGFDRDTVYEWGDAATGRTRLVNGGPGPLALDSMIVEAAGKPWEELSFVFSSAATAEKLFRPAFSAGALTDTVPSGGFAWLRTFDVIPSTCTLKIAADSAQGADTLSMRLRVRSKAGEEDTLVVTGASCARLSVSLRPFLAPGRRPVPANGGRDALGRNLPPPRFAPHP